MGTSVNLSFFLFFNIDAGDERRRPCNALPSALSPDPRHLAFAFAELSSTSDFYIYEVLGLTGSQDAENRFRLLYFLTDIENRLTIHWGFMDLCRFRAFGKMLLENGPRKNATKDFVPIPQIIDHAFSLPAHGRMARVDGYGLGPAEESYTQDEEGDWRYYVWSESHDNSFHLGKHSLECLTHAISGQLIVLGDRFCRALRL